jgi:hypothetical protein
MAKTYGVQVYSPARNLPIRTQGQLANSHTAGAILNPRSSSYARPRTQSFGGGGNNRGPRAPQGVAQRISVGQGAQQGGGYNAPGFGGPTLIDQMRAGRAPAPQQPDAWSGGFLSDMKGALGVAANSGPGRAVMGALNVLDMPRRATISAIHEISDAIGSGDASWHDWKTQFDDPSYGVGKYVDTGNWVLDGALGFAGDVLLDPMTYVAGSGVLAGVGRSTRLEASAVAAAIGMGDDVVSEIGRRGVGFLDNAQRAALRTATNEAGEHIGINVLDRGYYLRYFPGRDPLRIPGTGRLESAVASPFSRARAALATSNVGSYLRSRAVDPVDQVEAIERLITGKGALSATEAGERLNYTSAYRAGRGTARTTMRDGAASLIRGTPGGNDSLNVMLDVAERTGGTAINDYFASGAKMFENAGGVWQRGPRERYVPHFTTEGAAEWLDSSAPSAREFRAGVIPGTSAEQISPQLLERQLIAGRDYQFGGRQVKNATTGKLEWVGGRKMTVTDGTIKGLNDAFAAAFPETKGKFKLFEDDFQRIAAHYSESLAEDVGHASGYQRLANSRSGLVKSIDDVSDWKINQKETALRYGEISKDLQLQLKAKNDTVAQLRAAAKQQVHGIQGTMGVHMKNALEGLNTVAEPVRAELTDMLAHEQRLLKFVGGTTGVKGGPPEPGILEQRLNDEIGRISDRANALDKQIGAISQQASVERAQYMAATKATENASMAAGSKNFPAYAEWYRLVHERMAVSMDAETLDAVRNQLRNTRTKIAKIDANIENESFLNLVAGPQDKLPPVAEGEIRRNVIPANFDPQTGQMLSPQKAERLVARRMTPEEARVAGIIPTYRSPSQVRIHYNDQRRRLLAGTGIAHSDEIDNATVRLGEHEATRDTIAAQDAKTIEAARQRWIEARSEVAALRQQRSEIQGEVSNWADVEELDRRIEEATADDGALGLATTGYADAKRRLDAANQQIERTRKEINDLRNRQLAEARKRDEAAAQRIAYRAQRTQAIEEGTAPAPDIQAEIDRLTARRDTITRRRRGFRNPEADAAEVQRLQEQIDRLTAGPRREVEQVALDRPPPERLPLTSAQQYDAEQKLKALKGEHAEWARSEDAGHIARAQRDIERVQRRTTSIDRQRRPLVNSSNRVRLDEAGNYIPLNPNAVSNELIESRTEWEGLLRIAETERRQSQAMIYKADRGLLDEDEAVEAVRRFMRSDDDINSLHRQVYEANSRLRDEAFHDAPPAISGQGDKLRQLDDEAFRLARSQRQLDRFETLTGRKARQRQTQIEALSDQLREQADASKRIYQATLGDSIVETWEQRIRQINLSEDNALTKSYATGKPYKTEWEPLEPIKGEGRRAFPQEPQSMGRVGLLSDADRVELEDAYRVARHTPRRQRVSSNVLYQNALSTIKEIEGAVGSGISNHERAAMSEWSAVKRRIDRAAAGYDPSPALTDALKGKRGGVGDTTVAGRAKSVLDAAEMISDDKLDKLVTSGAIPDSTAADFFDTMNRLSETLDEYQRRPNAANHQDIDYLVQRGATHIGVFNSYGLALELGLEPSPELGSFLLRNEVHKQLRVTTAQLSKTEGYVATGAEAKLWGEWDAKIAAEDAIVARESKFIADQKEIRRATGKYSDPDGVGNAQKRITGAKARKERLRADPPKDFNEYQDSLDMMFDNVSQSVEELDAAVNDYNMMRRLPKEIEKPAELLARLEAKLDYDAQNLVEVRAENARLRSAIIKAVTEGKDTVRYTPTETVRETLFLPELRAAIEQGNIDPATAKYTEYLAGREEAAQRAAQTIPEGQFSNVPRKNVAMKPAASGTAAYAAPEPVTNTFLLQQALAEAEKTSDFTTINSLRQQLDEAHQIEWERAREVRPDIAPERAPRGGPIMPSERELELQTQITQLETKRRAFGISREEIEQLRRARDEAEKFNRNRTRLESEQVLPVTMRQPREPQPVLMTRKMKGKITEMSLEEAKQKLTFSSNNLEHVATTLHANQELKLMLSGEGQRELDALTTKIETMQLAGELPDPEDLARQADLTTKLENFKTVTFGHQEHITDVMDGGIRMLRDLVDGVRQIEPSDVPILRDLMGGMFQGEVAATYIERFNNLIERYVNVAGERRNIGRLGDLQQEFDAFIEEIRLTLGDNALGQNMENDVQQLMKSRIDDAMREAGDLSYDDAGLEDWAGEGLADSAEQVGSEGVMGPQVPGQRTPTDAIGEMRDRLFGALVASKNDAMKSAQDNALEQAQLLGIVTGSMDTASVSQLGYTMSKQDFDRGALRDMLRQRFADMGLDPRNALPERLRAQRARYAQLSMMDKFLGGSVTTARMRDPEAFFIALSQVEQSGGSFADQLKLFESFNVPEAVGQVDEQHLANLRQELKDAIKSNDSERVDAAQAAIDTYEGRPPEGTPKRGKAKAKAAETRKVDEGARHAAQSRINKADEQIAKIDQHIEQWHGQTLQDVIAESPRPPSEEQFTAAERQLANRQSVELGHLADELKTQEARDAARNARRRALAMAESPWKEEPQEFVDRAIAIADAMKGIPERGDTLAARRAALVAEREAAAEALSAAEGVERKAAAAAGRTLNDAELAQEFADATSEFNARLEQLGDLSKASADDVAQLNEMGERIITLARQRDTNVLKAKGAGIKGNDLYEQYRSSREAVGALKGKSDVTVDWLELMHAGLPNQSTIRGLAHKQAEGLGRRGPERYVLGSLLGDRATPEARGYLGGHFAVQEARAAGERAPLTRAQQRLMAQRGAAEAAIPALEGKEARLADIVGDQAGRDARLAEIPGEDAARVAQQVDDLRQARVATEAQHAKDLHTMYEAKRKAVAEHQRVQDRYTQNLSEMNMQLGDTRRNIAAARDNLTALDSLTETTQRAAAAAGNTSKELKPLLDDLSVVNQMRRDQVMLDTGADIGKRLVPGAGPLGPAMIDVGEETAIRNTEALINSAIDSVIHLGDQELDAKLLRDRIDQFAKGTHNVAPVLDRIVHDGWVQMADGIRGDAASLGVAEGLAGALKNLSEALRQPESWKLIDQYTNFFKTYATMTPGFHVRNAMSAIFMNFVDGVRATHMARAMPLWHEFSDNPLRFMESLETRPNGAKIRAAFEAVLGSGAGGQFVERGVGEAPSMTSAAYQRLMHNRITKFNTKVGSYVEGTARLGMALDTIERGGSMNQALARITKFHFDYTQVSRMDRTAKRLIPFWTFLSRNLPLQIEQMWLRPRTYLHYRSFVRNFGQMPDPYTPDYWLQQGAFTLDQNASESDSPWYLAPDLPFTRVTEPIDALMHGDLGKALLSDVNPLFAAPVEAYAAHQKFYTGQPIEGYSQTEGAMSWMTPLFQMLGATETGGRTGNTLVANSAQHMARSLLPPLNLAERLTSGTGTREGRQDETLYRALGAPVYQLTPGVRQSTRNSRAAARRNRRDQQAELARS